MKKMISAVCAMTLSAVMFTGCGCMNSNQKVDPTVMPTPEMTIAPTTQATTAPTTSPTTQPTTEATVLPTETGTNGIESTTNPTESTGNTARNRTPSRNG